MLCEKKDVFLRSQNYLSMKVLSIIVCVLSGMSLIMAGALIPMCARETNAIMLTCIAIFLCFFVAFGVFSVIHAFSRK